MTYEEGEQQRIEQLTAGLQPGELGKTVGPDGRPVAVTSEGEIFTVTPMAQAEENRLRAALDHLEKWSVIAKGVGAWPPDMAHDIAVDGEVWIFGSDSGSWFVRGGRILSGAGVMEQARAHGHFHAGRPVRAGLFIPGIPAESADDLTLMVQVLGLDPDNQRHRDLVFEWITLRMEPHAGNLYADLLVERCRKTILPAGTPSTLEWGLSYYRRSIGNPPDRQIGT